MSHGRATENKILAIIRPLVVLMSKTRIFDPALPFALFYLLFPTVGSVQMPIETTHTLLQGLALALHSHQPCT